ncbi:hypothetical protein [Peribacillus asahii]|uniref:hypothetical protein n=1 Tax=Peribacillus asahii TaxID=228899 RepID=UPI00207A92B0|nr:hypothetical protein [Peribacillus asahii]USK61351.1 hypothetical protein LIT37_08550 [Peribacillus asahii]
MPYSQKQWQDRIKDAQGNIIQEGTPFSAGNMNRMEQGIADAHAQLEEAGRQKQTLIHGLSVLNGGVDAPVNLEIEGRTLIPMQNTVLDPLKYYVLADKKTKLKWADATIQQGIAKFTAKAERPTLIRVANFEGKTAASTLENPHKALFINTQVTLSPPMSFVTEPSTIYERLSKLDGSTYNQGTAAGASGLIMQQLHSFDLVAEVERQVGRIPRSTLAEKVQWIKDNVAKITCNWHGFGSSVGGNKVSLYVWHTGLVEWKYPVTHTLSAVTKLALGATTISPYIDTNGFIYYLACAEPSDAATQSILQTDYVELEIELKPEAILHAPRVPLYEVTKEHYDAILVTMLEDEILRRYPSVEGVTHLQNPYVMAEGENLLPPFNEWVLHANTKLISAYEIELDATGVSQVNIVQIPALPNTTYTITQEVKTNFNYITFQDKAGNPITGTTISRVGDSTFTTPPTAAMMTIYMSNHSTGNGKYVFKNPMLTLGATAKPFVPRNPSYALFETKLGKIVDVADRIFEQDGKYFKRKAIEDVVLDGSLQFSYADDYAGFKRFKITDVSLSHLTPFVVTKHNGSLLKAAPTSLNTDAFAAYGGTGKDYSISVSDLETGFAETYLPDANDIKAYFNGWKAKTLDPTTSKPTVWVSIVDGTDAPTQTLDYVKANKAANYTPYKLSYVLATPKVEEIKSEGAISVNGLTQVEVGSGVIVREKVTPVQHSTTFDWYINEKGLTTGVVDTPLKNRAMNLLKIYKNGVEDKSWTIASSSANLNGAPYAFAKPSNYDATAEYTVTYLVFDRQLFTSNSVNVSVQFANNVRSALEDTVKKVEDNTTAISVNTNILYDVLKRLKAGGL